MGRRRWQALQKATHDIALALVAHVTLIDESGLSGY